jgi:hypothetical protein
MIIPDAETSATASTADVNLFFIMCAFLVPRSVTTELCGTRLCFKGITPELPL